jgi:cytochrome P450
MGALLSRLRALPWARAARVYLALAALHAMFKVWRRSRKWRRFTAATRHLRGGQPDVLGSKLRQNGHRILDFMLEELGQFPEDAVLLRSSPEMVLACNTRESVKFILKDAFQQVTKPDRNFTIFSMLEDFLGQGIFVLRHGQGHALEHEMWLRQRKGASLIFTRGTMLTAMTETFTAKGHRLCEALESISARNEAAAACNAAPEYVDMQAKFFSFTFDSIQALFFGREVNSVSGETDPYAQAFDDAHEAMLRHLLDTLPLRLAQRFLLPWPLGDVSESWPNSGLLLHAVDWQSREHTTFRRNVAFLRAETARMVRELRSDPKLGERRDMMANFAKMGDFGDEELVSLMLNMVIAGRDTTACALSWMLYELAINPIVQDAVAAEISSKLAGRDPTLADLEADNLPLLNGALFETLRLHPPVPADVKVASADITLPCGTLCPKGTALMFSPYVMGRSERRYKDALKFDPARWVPFVEPDQYDFPVFQSGNRICLGMSMAKLEAKMLMAMLLPRFRFALKEGEHSKISYTMSFTMGITNSADRKSRHLWVLPCRRAAAS